ncbi:MAG: hypothetical protein IAG13_18425 [Deltaproteobacteria bacterium]|nr:hypothetical protein [Nannocystaceae bacterium]
MPRHSLVMLCLALACGDDSTPQSDASSEGSSSGSSTTPASTSDSTAAGSESSADTSTTTPADSSSEGSSSSEDSGSSESGAMPVSCEPGQGRLVGELDGSAVDVDTQYGGVAASALGIEMRIGERARLLLRGDVDSVDGTDPLVGWGYLYMTPQDDEPQQWYCFDDESSYVSDGDSYYAATLTGLQAVGACPGTPVSGTVSVCFGHESCGGERSFVSDIEGASFSVPLGELTAAGGKVGATDITVNQDVGTTEGGTLHMHASEIDFDSTEPETAPIDGVYFIVPLAQPDGGAIYCAELGTLTYQMLDGLPETLSAEISSISRLGTCTGARSGDGHVEACLNFGS